MLFRLLFSTAFFDCFFRLLFLRLLSSCAAFATSSATDFQLLFSAAFATFSYGISLLGFFFCFSTFYYYITYCFIGVSIRVGRRGWRCGQEKPIRENSVLVETRILIPKLQVLLLSLTKLSIRLKEFRPEVLEFRGCITSRESSPDTADHRRRNQIRLDADQIR